MSVVRPSTAVVLALVASLLLVAAGGPAGSAPAPPAVDPLAISPRGDVSVRYVDSGGPGDPALLRVTTNPPLPVMILVDGIERDTWALTWPEFPVGSHQVCFGDMPGFAPPVCQNVLTVAGVTTEVVGTYSQNGYLRVVTDPPVASTISVYGADRNDWGLWTEVPPESYPVCFGPVKGFDPPPCRDVLVTAGATATTTGTFTQNPAAQDPPGSYGLLRAVSNPPVSNIISVDGIPRDRWGLSWIKLPTGTHDVCFGSAFSATSPSGCQTIDIVEGESTTVTGNFMLHGFLRVKTDPPVPANILIDGQIANAWGVWTDRKPGTYDVCFGDVAGFVTPPCQNDVAVSTGATATITGTYVPA